MVSAGCGAARAVGRPGVACGSWQGAPCQACRRNSPSVDGPSDRSQSFRDRNWSTSEGSNRARSHAATPRPRRPVPKPLIRGPPPATIALFEDHLGVAGDEGRASVHMRSAQRIIVVPHRRTSVATVV